MQVKNMYEYESVCLQITTKCNFMCRHCYLSCGPHRNEIMEKVVIDAAIEKIGSKSKRVWISGGEATLFPDLIEYIVKKCIQSREKTGYPHEICLQTNGAWALNYESAISEMDKYSEMGITDLDLSGYDKFHYEFHKGMSILELGALADRLHLFNSVVVSGSPNVDLKYLGRGKDLRNNLVFKNNCVLANGNYNINVYGDILICKWGNTCYLGSILEKNLDSIEKLEFVKILNNKGILGLIEEYNKKFGQNITFDGSTDICEICHKITADWKMYISEHQEYVIDMLCEGG